HGGEAGVLPDDKFVVHGHFRAQRYLCDRAYRLTFLRHPVSNLISIFFFWRLSPPFIPLHARFLEERPSIVVFARYPAFRTLMSEAYFGGFDMRRFDFIGFHESRDVDMPKLATAIGLPLSADVALNITPGCEERCSIEQDASVI